MKAKNIAVACFIGGLLCSIVGLWLVPMYYWLGIFAELVGMAILAWGSVVLDDYFDCQKLCSE